MKRICCATLTGLVLAVLLASALIAQAQDATPIKPTPDVFGWGKIKWGMSIQEARGVVAEFASQPVEPPGPNFVLVDRIMLKDVPIGDITCRIAIQAKRNSETVTAVTIHAIAHAIEQRSEAFDTLKKLLIEKYGQPKSEDRRREARNTLAVSLWSFPSTSIALRRLEGPYGIGYVVVEFSSVNKKSLDAM